MDEEVVSYCPTCKDQLLATRLSCRQCDLELTGEFALSKFDYLSDEEHDFVISFLKLQGSFKSLQSEKHISYPAAKKKLANILLKLGVQDDNKQALEISREFFLPIETTDSLVIKKIKEKLNDSGGKATITLFRGDPCEIWYDSNKSGLVSPKIPVPNHLTWEVFDAAIEVVINNGGKAVKGKARSGAKLGSGDLPVDSVEGYIAHKVHGVQEGETAFGPGFVICAILDWIEVCKNQRGYLSITPEFLKEVDSI